MSDQDVWTPERVRERLGSLGLDPDASDEQLGQVIEEVITDSQPVVEEPTVVDLDGPAHEVANALLQDLEPLPDLPAELVGKPCRCLDPDCTIPYGICHCGCGGRTRPYSSTDGRAGRVKGQYGLSKQRHTLRHDGGGVAMPFLADARRQSGYAYGKKPKKAREAEERKLVGSSAPQGREYVVTEDEHLERLVRLYDAFVAHADPATGMVQLAAFDAMLEAGSRHFGKRASRYGASLLFKDLVHMGCIKSKGPQHKQIIKHPREVDSRAVAFPATKRAQADKKTEGTVTHETLLDTVSPKEMADALANAMWTRYEGVLSEVGRLTGIVSGLTTENMRLQALLGEQAVDATEAARRILIDAEN